MGEPRRYGIFGFSFLDNNLDQLWGAAIDGVEPTFEGIASGDYPVSRGLFFYVKKEHIGMVPGLGEYVRFFASKQMIGETGATVDKGLIPLPDDEYKALIERINKEL